MKKILLFVSITILISCKTPQIVTIENNLNLPQQARYTNVKIAEGMETGIGPCEPSIGINFQNPLNLVAGSVLDNVHYSFDGGKSWETKRLRSKEFGVYGDPCIVNDSEGNFYYFHLANPDGRSHASSKFLNQMVLQKSTDGGKTWNDGTGIGKNEPKQQDKEWATIHPLTNQIYITWTEFDKYGSEKIEHKSRIRFATSVDGGTSFSEAITISNQEGDAIDDDGTAEGAVPAVDKEGNVYVAWSLNHKLFFNKSLDNGKTWQAKDQFIADQPGGWAQEIPDIGRCNGMPVTLVDHSDSEHKGTIYINWTDQRNGADNTDVFLIKSKDKGVSWSKPIKVNRDNTKSHQFFTWMTVDPKTGFIYIVYYDRSKYKDSKTDVVLAFSKDGGETFTSQTISENPFEPSKEVFFGDYNHIAAFDGIIRPIWTRCDDGVLSIWVALIEMK